MAEHVFGCSCRNADAPCLELEQPVEPLISKPQVTREAPGPFNFRLLPVELRLRILRHTHLGPASTGGYDAWHEELLIHNGKLDKDNFNPVDASTTLCPSKFTHHSSSPACTCRVLPTALFLVERLMHAEASEVFYGHACFNFHSNDTFSPSLDVLRHLPLHRLTLLKFTMSPAQADGWSTGALSCGFPEWAYQRRLELRQAAPREYQAGWAEVVDILAANAHLSRLTVSVDLESCGWAFADEGELLTLDEVDLGWFRFLYDFALGLATELCRLKTLQGVKFSLYPFANLEPWLNREVMGCRNGYGELPASSRRGFGNHIPSWHDMNKRLEGSNYRPS